MRGIYLLKYKSGIQKLIHLRTVSSVELDKNMLKIFYTFSRIDGHTIFGSGAIESFQAHDELIWPSHERAMEEFEKIKKGMEELQ